MRSSPPFSPGDPSAFIPGFGGQADQYRNTTYRGNFGYQLSPEVYVDLHTAYSNAYTSVPGEYVDPDPTASLLIEDWNLSPEVVAKVTDFYSTKLYYTRDQQRQAYNDPYNLAQALAFGFSPQGDVTRSKSTPIPSIGRMISRSPATGWSPPDSRATTAIITSTTAASRVHL
jgi:hypothetical protein